MKMVSEGESLPEFTVRNHGSNEISSSKITNAVIYFYPKADTPGCTKEACNFRDSISEFGKLDLEVYGVSTDSVESQRKFAEKNSLNFDLLADENSAVAEKFGVLKESGFTERTTFLIRNGSIEKIFREVDPEEHVEEVLTYLK